MGLLSLTLQDFRCFDRVGVAFSPQVNVIWGENASGKTSLLEAVFLASRGRSFRSGYLDPLTRHGCDGFQVVAKVGSGPAGTVSIGLERQQSTLKVRIGGRPASSLAELADTLPVQLIDNQAHLLIDGGPRHRRQFLDWGVFHVEPAFFEAWKRYQRAIRQRNTLLRRSGSTREVQSWDAELGISGELLDQLRRRYLDALTETAANWTREALGGLEVSLEYRRGWTEDLGLEMALRAGLERDRQQGGTQVGPHRADLIIKVDAHPARDRISRGQEKALAGTLLLAQAALYRQLTGKTALLLLDDLPAEFDPDYLQRFSQQIAATGSQTLITAIDPGQLPGNLQGRLFHVEQGKIL